MLSASRELIHVRWAGKGSVSYKLFQNPPQDDHEAGDMKEALVNGKQAVIVHHETAEVAELIEGAFHNPALLVAAQCLTVLSRRFAPVLPMRGD
jgi:hypothetical protein